MNLRRTLLVSAVAGATLLGTLDASARVAWERLQLHQRPVLAGHVPGGSDPRLVLPNGDPVPAWEAQLVRRLDRLQALGTAHRGVRKTVASSALRERRIQRARREAILSHRRGDALGAQLIVARALQGDPAHPVLVGLRARLLLVDGQPQVALAWLQHNGDGSAELLALQGVAALAAGDFTLALGSYRELLAIEPRDARWWVGLGFALQGSGEAGAADRAWRNALALGSNNPALVRLAAAARREPTRLAAAATEGNR